MSLVEGGRYECLKGFVIGTSKAQIVQVAKGDVAVVKKVTGVKMYFLKDRYLTQTAYGQYFKKKEKE